MSSHTHTLADWLAMVSIAASGYGSFSVFYFLLVDAAVGDFDPRLPLARLVESGRLDPLLIAVSNASAAVRDAVLDAAALLILLTTRPQGAMA